MTEPLSTARRPQLIGLIASALAKEGWDFSFAYDEVRVGRVSVSLHAFDLDYEQAMRRLRSMVRDALKSGETQAIDKISGAPWHEFAGTDHVTYRSG